MNGTAMTDGGLPAPIDEPPVGTLITKRRGRFAGTCPPKLPGQEVYCCKCPNDDPAAAYDFELMITLVRQGDMLLITQLVPIANGELLVATRSNRYQLTVDDLYVKTIKADSLNFGAARIARDKVSEYYRHFVTAFFSAETKIQRFDANATLLEEKTVSGFRFPPLPIPQLRGPVRDLSPAANASFHLEAARADAGKRLWFPRFTELEDGDYEVEDGQVFGAEERDAAATLSPSVQQEGGLPPGIYIEVLTQEEPPFAATIYRRVDADGTSTFLSGTYCTQFNHDQIWQWIKVKKKSSWFRTKTRVTTIRKELLVEGGRCHSIVI